MRVLQEGKTDIHTLTILRGVSGEAVCQQAFMDENINENHDRTSFSMFQ